MGFPAAPDHSPGFHVGLDPDDLILSVQKDHINDETHEAGVDGTAGAQKQTLPNFEARPAHQPDTAFPEGIRNDQLQMFFSMCFRISASLAGRMAHRVGRLRKASRIG